MARRYYPHTIHGENGKTHFPLPPFLHQELIYLCKGYPRMKHDYEDLLDMSSPIMDGMPKGTDISDMTARVATKRAVISEKIDAIDEALSCIPSEYQKGVWDNILYDKPYPVGAVTRTWTTYKGRFLYALAENLGRI